MTSPMHPDAMERPCKGCGKTVLFVVNGRTGKTISLDKASRAHIYEVSDAAEGGDVAYPAGEQQEVYVSRFLTCPKASDFSKKPQQGALL